MSEDVLLSVSTSLLLALFEAVLDTGVEGSKLLLARILSHVTDGLLSHALAVQRSLRQALGHGERQVLT